MLSVRWEVWRDSEDGEEGAVVGLSAGLQMHAVWDRRSCRYESLEK